MKSEINLSFIKQRREELGYTTTEMADVLGLNAQDKYSRRENGQYNFKAAELPALSKKLKAPIDSFFKLNHAKIEPNM